MTRTPPLQLAGTYRRSVNASLARIWENVFDWEHLAHLHDGSFAKCALVDAGDWGWRVALTPLGATSQILEMRADRNAARYTSTTLEGSGAGSEIRVMLAQVTGDKVEVTVEFHLPEVRPDQLAALGAAYSAVYARLWDEDEAMMQARERALAVRRIARSDAAAVDLGPELTVRSALPKSFEFGGAPFRLVALGGNLIAHSTVCPHWLGPLGDAPVIDEEIHCPWHGYRFGVGNGRCVAHPELRLATAPAIRVVGGRIVAERA